MNGRASEKQEVRSKKYSKGKDRKQEKSGERRAKRYWLGKKPRKSGASLCSVSDYVIIDYQFRS